MTKKSTQGSSGKSTQTFNAQTFSIRLKNTEPPAQTNQVNQVNQVNQADQVVGQPSLIERFALVCDKVAADQGGVAEGPFVTDFGRHTHQSMAAGAANCAAAIRKIERQKLEASAGYPQQKQSAGPLIQEGWYWEHQLASGKVINCGFSKTRVDPTSNAFFGAHPEDPVATVVTKMISEVSAQSMQSTQSAHLAVAPADVHEHAVFDNDQPVAEIVECDVMGQQTVQEIEGRWKFLQIGDKLFASVQKVINRQENHFGHHPDGGGSDSNGAIERSEMIEDVVQQVCAAYKETHFDNELSGKTVDVLRSAVEQAIKPLTL